MAVTTRRAVVSAQGPLPVGSNICRCGGCGETFNSVGAFDSHRSGDMDQRHCLTPEAMRAAGMLLNERGRWITIAYDGPQRGA